MTSFIPACLDFVHENIDPVYVEKKKEAKEALLNAELITTASLVMSIAFEILGIALTASGGTVAIIFGLPLILVSLPIGYFSYNSYKTVKNLYDVAENPKKYQNLNGLDPTLNKQKFKNKLVEGTIGFEWCIDLLIKQMSKNKNFGNNS